MSGTNTFPNAYINLQDDSVQTVPDTSVLPLHIPLFVMFTPKGPVGLPVLGGTNAQTAVFGSGITDERNPLFLHPNVFAKRALQYQQVYIARVVDPAAKPGTLVLLCTVTPGNLVQYQRTSSGSVILNGSGQPTPQLEQDGVTVVTQPGVTLSFTVRPLASGETISTVATSTTTNGGVTATTYPIIAAQGDIGSLSNTTGFSLYYNPLYSTTLVGNIGSMVYYFAPVTLNPSTNIASPVYDIYTNSTQVFSFSPGAFDPTTSTYYNLQDVVRNNFEVNLSVGQTGLPYSFYTYNTNVGTIGNAILAVSPELTGTSPYMINILSGVDANANTYQHMAVNSSAAATLNSNVVLYLEGGTDGVTTKTELESLTTQFVSGELNPEIGDAFRFPFTHFYDSGYALAAKQSLAGIFSLRDDVKLELSTQDIANPANTAAQDQSTGSALRTAMLLYPESLEFGTQGCRASIWQQCGTLSDTQVYTTIVPATIDRMIKRCLYNGSTFVKAEPTGRPNSEVTIFNLGSLNWTPSTNQQKQLSFSTNLNYMQYCDTATLFYPALISVYPIDNSLLISDIFVDYVAVYLKHIIRTQWTNFVGRDDPPKSLFAAIQKAIDGQVSYVFSGRITSTTTVSQTAVDSALGYQTTVTVAVQGNPANRVWQVVVPITRAAS
ncbi:unnamed protein product [Sphagnum jensenii]|uniref:Tail sheath protein gp29 gp29PR domain-containing protein n=1 Tax=Sphagnum jensenii TaxID=128206 RepID=A0ABP0VIB4_9BRYO